MRLFSIVLGCGIVLLPSLGRADRAATYYHQAMAYKQQGKIEQAIAALKQALTEREDYAAAHRSLGILYRERQRYGQAIQHLERAAELQPASGDVLYSLGLAYYGAGQRKQAITALEKAAKLKPDDAQVLAQCGSLLVHVDPERALPYLRAAVKLKPKSGDNLHQLGLAYRRAAGQASRAGKKKQSAAYMDNARQYLTQAAAFKDTAGLHFDLGVLYRRLEKPLVAIEHYARAVELDPKLAAAWWDLGHMYAKTDQPELAVEAYQRYLKLEGTSKDASIARKRIKELKGREKPKPKPKR